MLPILFNLLLGLYRLAISPILHLMTGPGFGCRFEPTCSQYANQAIDAFGPFKGSFFALKRICRCNPFARAGYDPVPHAIGNPYRNYH